MTQEDSWIERWSRTADARQVAVIDFERAFATLDTNDQITLLLTYRDAVPARHAADILGLTPSMVHFHARQALTRLANVLDRLDLL